MKRKLSEFGNSIFNTLWFKIGSPSNINVVELALGSDESHHIRKLVFGNMHSERYDGVKLQGEGSARHFNYRALQAVKSSIKDSLHNNQEENVVNNIQLSVQRKTKAVTASSQLPSQRYGQLLYSIPVKNRYEGNL